MPLQFLNYSQNIPILRLQTTPRLLPVYSYSQTITILKLITRSERSIKFAFIQSYVFLYSDVFIMKVKIQLISISLVDCASTSTSASTCPVQQAGPQPQPQPQPVLLGQAWLRLRMRLSPSYRNGLLYSSTRTSWRSAPLVLVPVPPNVSHNPSCQS